MGKSRLYRVNLSDIFESCIVLSVTSFLTSLLPVLNSGNLPTIPQLKTSLIVGLCTGITYLIKKFATNSEGKFLQKNKIKNEIKNKKNGLNEVVKASSKG